MDYKKLETAVYAQGFVEDYIERHAAETSDDTTDVKHRQEVLAAWKMVDEAFTQLIKENKASEQKLFALRTILA